MPPLDALTAKADAYQGMRSEGWSYFVQGYIRSVTGKEPARCPPSTRCTAPRRR